LVEANDKNYGRIKVLKTLCERLEAALKGSGCLQRRNAAQNPGNGLDAFLGGTAARMPWRDILFPGAHEYPDAPC
jgi:hypothetical protein